MYLMVCSLKKILTPSIVQNDAQTVLNFKIIFSFILLFECGTLQLSFNPLASEFSFKF